MEVMHGRVVKSTDEVREHFLERLKERYAITMTAAEYADCCVRFWGIFKKHRSKTLGYVDFKGVRLWCLYEKHGGLLTTCYPSTIATDPRELIFSCFHASARHMANTIYDSYQRERELLKKDFESDRNAAIYYFANTLFPTLHIDEFKKGTVDIFKIMHQISSVIDGTSRYVKLRPVIIPPDERK